MGTAQPASGAPSCEPCAAGSYQWYVGSTECTACPRNSYSAADAEVCDSCGCDDGVACTRDTCDAVTGACSAPPVDGCEVAKFSFEGAVVSVDPALAACFAVGEPVAGSFAIDPEAPDAEPASPLRGTYQGLESLEIDIGDRTDLATFLGDAPGAIGIVTDAGGYDAVFDTSVDAPVLACGTPASEAVRFEATLSVPAGEVLLSDVARLVAFPSGLAIVAFGDVDPQWVVAQVTIASPEPDAAALAVAAAVALASLRLRRVRS